MEVHAGTGVPPKSKPCKHGHAMAACTTAGAPTDEIAAAFKGRLIGSYGGIYRVFFFYRFFENFGF